MKRLLSELALFWSVVTVGPLAAAVWHLVAAAALLPTRWQSWLGAGGAAEAYPLYLQSDRWLLISTVAAAAAGFGALLLAARLPCGCFGPWPTLGRLTGVLSLVLALWAVLHLWLAWETRVWMSVLLPLTILLAVFFHGLAQLSELLRLRLLGAELGLLARAALVSSTPLVAALLAVVLANRIYAADGRRIEEACELLGRPGAVAELVATAGALPYAGSSHHQRAVAARRQYLDEAAARAGASERLLAGDRLDQARLSFRELRELYPDAPEATAAAQALSDLERRGDDLHALVRHIALLQPERLRAFFAARGRQALEMVGPAYQEISYQQNCTDAELFRSYRVRIHLEGEEVYWANVQTFDGQPLDVWINILDEPFVAHPEHPQEPERALEAVEEIAGEWDQVSRRDSRPLRESEARCFLAREGELGYLVKWTQDPGTSQSMLQMTLFTDASKALIRCRCQRGFRRFESHTCHYEYPPCTGPRN